MNNNIANKILEVIIPITIITIILLFLIFLIRIIFYFVISALSIFYIKNRRKARKKAEKLKKTEVTTFKKDEELLRDKQNEEKQEKEETFTLEGVQRMNEEFESKMSSANLDNGRIVDIVKPIGFWTSLILGDQLSQILGRAYALNERSQKGFWVSMLEAQARGLGRQYGKQRG